MDDTPEVDITSSRNRWIKLARSLHRRRTRYRERAILVEGVRPVSECLESGKSVQALLIAASRVSDAEATKVAAIAAERSISTFVVDDEILSSAADTETPQGILAIVDMPTAEIPGELPENPLVLIIDSVRDPGNLGTLLRSALGTGVDLILIGPESVDPYAPKVIRAGAGSHFRLPIAFLSWDGVPDVLKRCTLYVTQADADIDYVDVDWCSPAAVIVGNETGGVSEAAIAHADGRVGIPLASKLESLNAGIAGSVILFEAWRQRRRRLLRA